MTPKVSPGRRLFKESLVFIQIMKKEFKKEFYVFLPRQVIKMLEHCARDKF